MEFGTITAFGLIAALAAYLGKKNKKPGEQANPDSGDREGVAIRKGEPPKSETDTWLDEQDRIDSVTATPRTGRRDKRVMVFDTNSLINHPYCIFLYGNADIVIPPRVIEELEAIKHDTHKPAFVRTAARSALATVAHICQFKSPTDEAYLMPGSFPNEQLRPLLYLPSHQDAGNHQGLDLRVADDQVIAFCIEILQGRTTVILVTNDNGLKARAKSRAFRLDVTNFDISKVRPRAPIPVPEPHLDQMEATLEAMFNAIADKPELDAFGFTSAKAAAEAGSPYAARVLGGMYRLGKGTPASRKQAVGWLAKAAAAGEVEAFEMLKLMALTGDVEDEVGADCNAS